MPLTLNEPESYKPALFYPEDREHELKKMMIMLSLLEYHASEGLNIYRTKSSELFV